MNSNLPAIQRLEDQKNTLVKIAALVRKEPEEMTAAVVAAEVNFLAQRIHLEPALQECSPESLLDCARQAIRDNLSLERTAGLVYIYPQSVNIGTKKQPQWIKVASYQRTPDGIISVCRQTGRILDIKRPKLDLNPNGAVMGGHVEILKPSYPSPRWETVEFDTSDILRWKGFSAKKNRGKANHLYSSHQGGIDPEFMRAKIVKHALKKMGTNVNELDAINQVQVTPMFTPEMNQAAVEEMPHEVVNVEPAQGDNPFQGQ